MPVTQFKAKCLRLLEDVEKKGDRIIITKRGRPVAQVGPTEAQRRPLRGMWKDTVKILGDIVYFDANEDWKSSS